MIKIKRSLVDQDANPSSWYLHDISTTDDLNSPSDFSYMFDYNVNDNQANLDFTLNMSMISSSELYDAVQGYGLILPQYSFFLSSNYSITSTRLFLLELDKYNFL